MAMNYVAAQPGWYLLEPKGLNGVCDEVRQDPIVGWKVRDGQAGTACTALVGNGPQEVYLAPDGLVYCYDEEVAGGIKLPLAYDLFVELVVGRPYVGGSGKWVDVLRPVT